MEGLAIALLALALLLFIAEAHAPTTVLGLLGVAALVGAGFAWRDAGHDLPVAAIVDGGELPGTPSTVLDLTGQEPQVLREGAVPAAEALERALASGASSIRG